MHFTHFSLPRLATLLLAGALAAVPALAQPLTLTRSATIFTGTGTYQPTVAFGNGTFVALGFKTTPFTATTTTISAYTSPDGNVWTERVVNVGGGGFASHGAIRFINGRFVFSGVTLGTTLPSYTATSTDGITWNVANTPNSAQFADVVTGGGTTVGFIATTLSSSTDGGATWTSRAASGVGAFNPYQAIAYGNGRFVLLAGNRAWTSPDGATWSDIAGSQSSGRVAYGNGLFALTGTAYRTSTDGVTFTPRTPVGMTLTGTNTLRFAAGRFLYHQFTFSGITPINEIISSTDGITWTSFASYPTGAIFNMNDVAEGNNRLVVVGFTQTQVPIAAFLDTTALPTPPAISTQPLAQSAVIGGSVTFTAAASGTGNTYQWRKDNVVIAGATAATYTIATVTAASAGSYTVVVTNSAGSSTSSAATLTLVSAADVSRLSNLSVRTTLTANQVLTVGFTMSGGAKNVLVRAAGPGLGALGVPGTMADPKLTLFNGSTAAGNNDNWAGNTGVASAITAVGAFPFASTTSLDAALVASVDGGRTVQVSGPAAGNLIVEAYDAGTGNSPRLTNLSALNRVGTGADVLIAGFTIAGATTKNVLIRAVGPSLAAAPFNIGGALADPKLEIYNSAQTKIGENDTYAAGLAATSASVGAFPLVAGSKDAAIVVSLPPGGYTVQVSGADGGTGLAIIELYELP